MVGRVCERLHGLSGCKHQETSKPYVSPTQELQAAGPDCSMDIGIRYGFEGSPRPDNSIGDEPISTLSKQAVETTLNHGMALWLVSSIRSLTGALSISCLRQAVREGLL